MKTQVKLGALMLLIYVSSCTGIEEKQEIAEYPIIQPKIQTSEFQVSYVAEINAIENIEIRSKVEGVVEKVLVDEGQYVREGQALFQISSATYVQDLKKAQAVLSARVANLKATQIELANGKRLVDKNIISRTELELIEARENAARADVKEAEGEVEQCELNLTYTRITAPFSGRINRILLKRGSLVSPELLITTLSNDQSVYAYFNLNESEFLQFKRTEELEGPKVVQLILSDGSIYSQKGVVETAESEVDRNTGNIALRARFSNDQGLLKHGSSGKVLLTRSIKNSILIPKQSTFEVQELTYVYVVDQNGLAKQRSVKICGQLPLFYVIEGGLKSDEWILFEGVQMIHNNEKINAKRIDFPMLK